MCAYNSMRNKILGYADNDVTSQGNDDWDVDVGM